MHLRKKSVSEIGMKFDGVYAACDSSNTTRDRNTADKSERNANPEIEKRSKIRGREITYKEGQLLSTDEHSIHQGAER